MRTETKATTEATRSISEWTASVRIAIEPVIAPAASLIAIRSELEAIESAAAPLLVRIIAAPEPPRRRSGAAASSLAARPRWLISFFSAWLSSDIVRWSSSPVSSGTKAGS